MRIRIAAVTDVHPDRPLAIEFRSLRLLVYRVRGEWRAVSGTCTHREIPLADRLVDCQLTCPLHGAQFDALTGESVRGPAALPLMCLPVVEVGGELFIESSDGTLSPQDPA